MSSKKITDLTSYSAAELIAGGGNDLYFITDIANQETKAITALESAKYANSINGISYDGLAFTMSGSVSASSYTASVNGVGFLGTASWAASASNALTASYAANAATVTATNNGLLTSIGIVQQGIGPSLLFKNISGSSNISITDDITNNNIIISYTGGGGSGAGGPVNSIQFNYPAGILNGDSNFTYTQATSTVSSSLTIYGVITASAINSTASAVGFVGTASWAQSSSNASTASFVAGANVSGSIISSSYALSSSYSLTSSYALAANVLTTYSSISAQCFGVRYPLGNLTYQNYHYFTSYQHVGYTTLFRQNQNTNEIEKVYNNYGTRRMNGGHLALHRFNNNGTTEDCIVFGDEDGYINIIGNLSSTPTARSIYVGTMNWRRFRCIYVDSTNVTNPTFYMAPDSNDAGTATNMYIYNVYYSSGYNISSISAFELTSTLISNYAAFQTIITGPTDNFYILSQIYNPVKKRFYVVHNALGMCSVFNISSYGNSNIGTWWQQADAVKLPQLTYEKTITIPQQGSNYWKDSKWETYGLEYDTITGQEKNWVWNRIGYDNGNGAIGKSPWFGT